VPATRQTCYASRARRATPRAFPCCGSIRPATSFGVPIIRGNGTWPLQSSVGRPSFRCLIARAVATIYQSPGGVASNGEYVSGEIRLSYSVICALVNKSYEFTAFVRGRYRLEIEYAALE